MSLGNVIGSNISNIALVLGLTALILPIPVRRGSIRWDWLIMMGASLLFFVFTISGNAITRIEGFIMVTALAAYVVWSIYGSRRSNSKAENETDSHEVKVWFSGDDLKKIFSSNEDTPLVLGFVLVILSSLGLVFGANMLVEGASGIARSLGVSERVIAVSVIALGTSLPELATSIMAAIRKQMDISIGNIIGSNIFNILGILGVTSIVTPIPLEDHGLVMDIAWMMGISILLILLVIPFKKKYPLRKQISCIKIFFKNDCKEGGLINRWEGVFLSAVYLSYIVWVFVL